MQSPICNLQSSIVVVALALLTQDADRRLPTDIGAVMKKVREVARLDYEIQKEFTYIEKRRDVRSGLVRA